MGELREGGRVILDSIAFRLTVSVLIFGWPSLQLYVVWVQCTLGKKKSKKSIPETACSNVPKEICVPSNCEVKAGPQVMSD
jgi:hypothetical protein